MKYSYKPITKTLFQSMQRYFPSSGRSSFLKLSLLGREKVMSLFQEIHESHQRWKSNKKEIMSTKKETREMIKPSIEKYNYIPIEIREKIEQDCSPHIHYSYSFDVYSRKITVHFTCSKNITQTELSYKIERIYMWFQIACKQNPNIQCSEYINIYLYCIDFPKVLPSPNTMATINNTISEVHANTAFTTNCQTSTDIILFREEEWFKVLIHESFHNLGLDFNELSSSDTKVLDDRLREMFHIEKISDIRLYETYCETWAELLNIIFIVYYTNIVNRQNQSIIHIKNTKRRKTKKREKRSLKLLSKTLIQNMTNQFEQQMIYESMFSCFQCAKIMDYNRLHYADFIQHKGNIQNISPSYRENTYCFSYYILKSIFLFHFPSFFDFAIHQNNSDQIMKFRLTLENGNKFVDLIQQNYQDPVYMQIVSKMEHWIHTYSIDPTAPPEIKTLTTTLRMTLFEI